MVRPPIKSLRAYDSVSDRIRQHRQADSRGILVVEGPSDKRLIDRSSNRRWAIFPAGTRDEVPLTVQRASDLGVGRIAGIIDRDFDNFVERWSEVAIYTYEEADLEAFLVRGPWFASLIEELGSEAKIASGGGVETLRSLAIGLAGVVGLVRRANAEQGWGIDFERLDFARKIDARTLRLAIDRLCAAVQGQLADAQHRREIGRIIADVDPQLDRGQGSFRGRDALDVVKIALQRVYGSRSGVDTETLAGSLRLAVGAELLELDPMRAVARVLEGAL